MAIRSAGFQKRGDYTWQPGIRWGQGPEEAPWPATVVVHVAYSTYVETSTPSLSSAWYSTKDSCSTDVNEVFERTYSRYSGSRLGPGDSTLSATTTDPCNDRHWSGTSIKSLHSKMMLYRLEESTVLDELEVAQILALVVVHEENLDTMKHRTLEQALRQPQEVCPRTSTWPMPRSWSFV
ncbi:unnamed protein product [Phytophthora fragariaefolia]|uniref:Unnamed protein product n=1 Tax=Phytophthora fragariaefolia TaxID=1490495 RepID=A0A9W6X6T7_9STRA|nr:unnamed protein product [Phytophthora fragariaefolia]